VPFEDGRTRVRNHAASQASDHKRFTAADLDVG
jgi:hypothetical protein